LEESHGKEYVGWVEQKEIEVHMHREIQSTTREEKLCGIGHEEQVDDQVSKFLHFCLNFLSDIDFVRKLTHMLIGCTEEEGTIIAISTPSSINKLKRKEKRHGMIDISNKKSFKWGT
jgi:hypothetical protein